MNADNAGNALNWIMNQVNPYTGETGHEVWLRQMQGLPMPESSMADDLERWLDRDVPASDVWR